MTFEQSLDRLEDIVRELEGSDLELERALALFEEGIAHLRVANSALTLADARVQQLVEVAGTSFSLAEYES
ncbi:MAG: exodeoxyribonuclease VII small subunit [Gemmatimonadota bacterium]